MSDPVSKVDPKLERRLWGFVLGTLGLLFFISLPYREGGIVTEMENPYVQNARAINLYMFQYSTDNSGSYPDGQNSTEIFQKLLDRKYANDPTIFYFPFPGKIKPVPGQRLKPENVCWDVTSCPDSDASDLLPTVFMTGYKVSYAPGSAAIPLEKPFPPWAQLSRTWSDWWNNVRIPDGNPGIAVAYHGNNATFVRFDSSTGTVPNFIPPAFDAHGKTYRQLTPDGPLP